MGSSCPLSCLLLQWAAHVQHMGCPWAAHFSFSYGYCLRITIHCFYFDKVLPAYFHFFFFVFFFAKLREEFLTYYEATRIIPLSGRTGVNVKLLCPHSTPKVSVSTLKSNIHIFLGSKSAVSTYSSPSTSSEIGLKAPTVRSISLTSWFLAC